jgi:hypothetical protein
MTFSSARAAHTKTKTRLAAGRAVPRRVQRGRGHQLWRAVLGNPIPIKTVNYYPVTRVDSTDGTDNSNDTAPSTALANGMRAPLFGFRRATSSGESDRTNGTTKQTISELPRMPAHRAAARNKLRSRTWIDGEVAREPVSIRTISVLTSRLGRCLMDESDET